MLAIIIALYTMGAVVAAAATPTSTTTNPPHLVFILADDLGWAEVGWHRPPNYREVQTPVLDSLVREGVELNRHYVHKFCSPSRCAIQSGRAPVHVNTINADPAVFNPEDPDGGYAGIPRNMTGIAEKLRDGAGYQTHFVGKWDAGMATPQHTPIGRGYMSTTHYFHHANARQQKDFAEHETLLCCYVNSAILILAQQVASVIPPARITGPFATATAKRSGHPAAKKGASSRSTCGTRATTRRRAATRP